MIRCAAILLLLLPALSGCAGVQSALDPAGEEAGRINVLSWTLFVFCSVVFLGVAMLALAAIFGPEPWRSRLGNKQSVIIGGLLFPAVALTGLLAYSIAVIGMGDGDSGDDPQALHISVVGERWWWRVIYRAPDGRPIESANEIRLPVGRTVRLELTSADVIHSFWAPRLAGKLDMIPGRRNTLTLRVNEPGISRGQCAEYCGGAHALMAFFVIVLEQDAFDEWLIRESERAKPPVDQTALAGEALFLQSGCSGCHTVRGTHAAGTIGPDLTHVGSRHSLAAATLPNSPKAIADWIVENQHIKPENLMPPFEIFTQTELASLSAYLAQLR